tara:strand:+ start:7825 stop:8721 length:897 start_codon:yes stop_codon:yes gene_type:complete
MMEESLEGGAAPVSEVPTSEVVADAPAEASDAPSSPTSETTSEAASTPEPEAQVPALPSYDDFGWDDWTGDVSALPEQIQPWAQKVYDSRQSWADQRVQEGLSESNRIKDIYNALLDGHDDPRFNDLQKQHTELQAQFEALTNSSGQVQAEYDGFKQEMEKAIEQEATRYADWFERTHGHLFQEPEGQAKFETLLNAGWDVDAIPGLMDLPDDALELASKALQDGVPAQYAIQLAKQSVPQKAAPAKPRPAARITSGATSAPAAPNQLKSGGTKVSSLDDMRLLAAANAVKRHSGGRR